MSKGEKEKFSLLDLISPTDSGPVLRTKPSDIYGTSTPPGEGIKQSEQNPPGKNQTMRQRRLMKIKKEAMGLNDVPIGGPVGSIVSRPRDQYSEADSEAQRRTGFGGESLIDSVDDKPPTNKSKLDKAEPPAKPNSQPDFFNFLERGNLYNNRKAQHSNGDKVDNKTKELKKLASVLKLSGYSDISNEVKKIAVNVGQIASDAAVSGILGRGVFTGGVISLIRQVFSQYPENKQEVLEYISGLSQGLHNKVMQEPERSFIEATSIVGTDEDVAILALYYSKIKGKEINPKNFPDNIVNFPSGWTKYNTMNLKQIVEEELSGKSLRLANAALTFTPEDDPANKVKQIEPEKPESPSEPVTPEKPGAKASNSQVAAFQKLIGMPEPQDGVWGRNTNAAFKAFVESKASLLQDPSVVDSIAINWSAAAQTAKIKGSEEIFAGNLDGATKFVQALIAKGSSADAAPVTPVTPATPSTPVTPSGNTQTLTDEEALAAAKSLSPRAAKRLENMIQRGFVSQLKRQLGLKGPRTLSKQRTKAIQLVSNKSGLTQEEASQFVDMLIKQTATGAGATIVNKQANLSGRSIDDLGIKRLFHKQWPSSDQYYLDKVSNDSIFEAYKEWARWDQKLGYNIEDFMLKKNLKERDIKAFLDVVADAGWNSRITEALTTLNEDEQRKWDNRP